MKSSQGALTFIFQFVKKQRFYFFSICLCFVLWAVCDAIFPYFLKRIIDQIEFFKGDPKNIYSAIFWPFVTLVFLGLFAEICMRIQGVLQIYVFPTFRSNIRKTVFDYVKSHSHDYFSSHFAGNIAKKLADLPTSCQVIVEIICMQLITAATGTLIVLGSMWVTKPLFALILLAWLFLHIAITFVFLHYENTLAKLHSQSVSTLSGKIVDTLTNISNVRLFARGSYESRYLKQFQDNEIQRAEKAMWLTEIMRAALGFNGIFMLFGMIFALIYGWAHHFVTIGDFTQIAMQAFWLLNWIWFVSLQLNIYVREMGTVSDALTLITRRHELTDKQFARPLIITEADITFHNVNFSYGKNKPVFQNLSITISAGQKVGLVGSSGSGKSTFVNLMLRFYDLQSGSITIAKQNIADVSQDSLREAIAMIPQDPSLFHRSLIENIRYGRLGATDQEVIEASKMAHCHDFIMRLPDGYQTLVGERGTKLSGGQRQRIAIARAILKHAPILILDEATSALDSLTEKLIQESLHQLMQEQSTTALVIAHRLSTLGDMDRILVFHKGQIIEDGSIETLLASNGHFATLWNMQHDGFFPDE
ncbi:MAG TPA: ABC transporter ATP-binding protein [Gammaproteobacteria bacterium]|jgi:ATP-binding cassette subfamily B protein|nr:ABC transporter ATP-binding protein [Gammaproteobacteria bacterium]